MAKATLCGSAIPDRAVTTGCASHRTDVVRMSEGRPARPAHTGKAARGCMRSVMRPRPSTRCACLACSRATCANVPSSTHGPRPSSMPRLPRSPGHSCTQRTRCQPRILGPGHHALPDLTVSAAICSTALTLSVRSGASACVRIRSTMCSSVPRRARSDPSRRRRTRVSGHIGLRQRLALDSSCRFMTARACSGLVSTVLCRPARWPTQAAWNDVGDLRGQRSEGGAG